MTMFDGLHVEPVYNTRAVANRTGIPADTFRAWERRYQLPAPCRSDGNQRLYSERDVAIIIWLRDKTRSGMTISHAVTLFHTLHLNPSASSSTFGEIPTSVDADPQSDQVADIWDRPSYFEICLDLLGALSRFDTTAAERLIFDLVENVPVEAVCHEVLRPSMDEIRRRRADGVLSVSVERFAQAFMHRKISALFNHSHPETGRGPIVAAGVEGEHDEIDLLCLSLLLSHHGFSVIYLGTDIAAPELGAAISTLNPVLVVLNACSESVVPALEHALSVLKDAATETERPAIGITGQLLAQSPALCDQLQATYIGNTGLNAVKTCDRLIGANLS